MIQHLRVKIHHPRITIYHLNSHDSSPRQLRLQSIRYQCPKLWNEVFKKGFIQVDNEKNNNIKLSEIKTKKGFNNVLKKYFLHSYTIELDVYFY